MRAGSPWEQNSPEKGGWNFDTSCLQVLNWTWHVVKWWKKNQKQASSTCHPKAEVTENQEENEEKEEGKTPQGTYLSILAHYFSCKCDMLAMWRRLGFILHEVPSLSHLFISKPQAYLGLSSSNKCKNKQTWRVFQQQETGQEISTHTNVETQQSHCGKSSSDSFFQIRMANLNLWGFS